MCLQIFHLPILVGTTDDGSRVHPLSRGIVRGLGTMFHPCIHHNPTDVRRCLGRGLPATNAVQISTILLFRVHREQKLSMNDVVPVGSGVAPKYTIARVMSVSTALSPEMPARPLPLVARTVDSYKTAPTDMKGRGRDAPMIIEWTPRPPFRPPKSRVPSLAVTA